jgi:hypothetical protein
MRCLLVCGSAASLCGKALLFRNALSTIYPRLRLVFTISRDHPCLYLTAAAKDRLPVFRTDSLKVLACTALDEARKSAGFRLFAYAAEGVAFQE